MRTQKPEMHRTRHFVNGDVAFWWRDVGMPQRRRRLPGPVEVGVAVVGVSGLSVQHSWTGVLGVPRDWCAAVNFEPTTGMASAGGYVGHGLTGANLAARTLRDLILGHDTELIRYPWVGRHARRWEVEPIRWAGATTLYAAYRYADHKEATRKTGKTAASACVAHAISGR
jgi:hypothetical protein